MADKTGYIGRNPSDSSVVIARQTFEPSTSTSDFTFTAGYTPGYLDLYINGARQIEGRDYNANDGSTVSLVSAATSGDVLEIIAYKAFNVGDAASSSTGNFAVGNDLSVNNNAAISNDLNVTGITTTGLGLNVSAGGANISGVVTATSYQGDGSALTGIAATDTIAAASLTVSGITTLSNELIVKQGGIEVDLGGLDVNGIGTFASHVEFVTDARIAGNINAGIATFGAVTVTSITGDGSGLTGVANTDFVVSTATTTSRLVVGGGVTISGIATASSFDGAISEWTLVSGDGSNYAIKGPGLTGSENDPTLYLKRGQRYNFKNSTGGHPFRIQSTPYGSSPASSGTAYNDGVTNNDAGDGTTLIFDVQHDAPSRLYYQCTSHSAMGGQIIIDTGYSNYDDNGFEVAHAGTANTVRMFAGGSVGTGIGVTTTTGRNAGVGTVKGQVVYNESTNAVQVYSGIQWNNIFTEPFTASGGTEITDGDNKYHVFTSPGNFVVNTGEKSKFDVLVIGGGGGGGENNSGGGGAGGLVYIPQPVSFPIEGTVPVAVGGGGEGQTSSQSPGQAGSDSTFGASPNPFYLIAKGGGASTAWTDSTPQGFQNGGSAAGGSGTPTSNPDSYRNAGTALQPTQSGNSGTYGHGSGAGQGGRSSGDTGAAGGGGAGGASSSVPSPGSEPGTVGTDGGAGYSAPAFPGPVIAPAIPSPVRPAWTPVVGPTGTFAGGGGGGAGGSHPGNMAEGGSGGGGRGGSAQGSVDANPGINFTGSGGGGGDNTEGGDGGTGIVIVKYDTTTTGAG